MRIVGTPQDVGRKNAPPPVFFDELARGHNNFTAEMPALFLAEESWSSKCTPCGARFNHRFHQLVKRSGEPPKSCLGVPRTIGANQYVPDLLPSGGIRSGQARKQRRRLMRFTRFGAEIARIETLVGE